MEPYKSETTPPEPDEVISVETMQEVVDSMVQMLPREIRIYGLPLDLDVDLNPYRDTLGKYVDANPSRYWAWSLKYSADGSEQLFRVRCYGIPEIYHGPTPMNDESGLS